MAVPPAGQSKKRRQQQSRSRSSGGDRKALFKSRSQEADAGPGTRKADVRFGCKDGGHTVFALQPRFEAKKPQTSDAYYKLPSGLIDRPFTFGTSTRDDWRKIYENTKDLHNPNAGPGNYRLGNENELLSECPKTKDITFGLARREGMALTTSAPGVLYSVEGVYKYGPALKGKILPGFNLDKRKGLAENGGSTTSTMYWPRLPSRGGTVYFGHAGQNRFATAGAKERSPGPVYDTVKYGFQSGPSFSFGASRRDRWGNLRMPTVT